MLLGLVRREVKWQLMVLHQEHEILQVQLLQLLVQPQEQKQEWMQLKKQYEAMPKHRDYLILVDFWEAWA